MGDSPATKAYKGALERLEAGKAQPTMFWVVNYYDPKLNKTIQYKADEAGKGRLCKMVFGNAFTKILVNEFGPRAIYWFAGKTAKEVESRLTTLVEKWGTKQSPQWKGTPTTGDLGFVFNELLRWVRQTPGGKFRVI